MFQGPDGPFPPKGRQDQHPPTLEVLEGLLHLSAFYTLALGADLEAVVSSYVILGLVADVDLRCWPLVLFLVAGLELGT
jgi:hypothetical protein